MFCNWHVAFGNQSRTNAHESSIGPENSMFVTATIAFSVLKSLNATVYDWAHQLLRLFNSCAIPRNRVTKYKSARRDSAGVPWCFIEINRIFSKKTESSVLMLWDPEDFWIILPLLKFHKRTKVDSDVSPLTGGPSSTWFTRSCWFCQLSFLRPFLQLYVSRKALWQTVVTSSIWKPLAERSQPLLEKLTKEVTLLQGWIPLRSSDGL
jgi:hypothetical protein